MGFGNYLTGALKGRLPHLLSCKCFIALTLIVCGPPKSVEYKVFFKHMKMRARDEFIFGLEVDGI
jgi:hypothetical protein